MFLNKSLKIKDKSQKKKLKVYWKNILNLKL